ncbi:MAG: hypothetical protein BGO14_01450 [Chlamydiales bacterium 38-26]|nr:DoxX family protein [Chlamydiales bacterium]OJV08113.1 MAG: hypothetical protein BGO14_01450 [Chlamydiales bacterium 38-26]
MDYVKILLQLVVALGLLNVWLVRRDKKTAYRGCDSQSLKNEFAAYGLPLWSFYLIGFIKVTSAFALLLGLWWPVLVFPAALVISILMAGALCMHIKVKDSWIKSLPASLMLIFSAAICLLSFY